MSKIDEIVRSVDPNVTDWMGLDNWTLNDVEYCMKTYAEWYAKRCLDQVAENANLRCQGVTSLEEFYNLRIMTNDGFQDIMVDVNTESITNITLPEHE